MSREISALLLELTQRVQAAFDEADAATAEVVGLREQRHILLQQLHDRTRETTRQRARIALLCDENRRLRAERDSWLQVAA